MTFEFTDEELAAGRERYGKRAAPAPVAAEGFDLVAKMQALAESATAANSRFACYPHTEEVDQLAACDKAGQEPGCARRRDQFCPRYRIEKAAQERLGAIRKAGCPERLSKLLSRVLEAPRGLSGGLAATDAVSAVQDFLGSQDWCLVLAGPAGTGKTVGAGSALLSHTGLWLNARALCNVETEVGPYEAARLLILDDVGTEYAGANGYSVARVTSLIEARYEADARTIVTTNLSPKAFADRYGDRVADRLRDGGRIVACAGASLRGAK